MPIKWIPIRDRKPPKSSYYLVTHVPINYKDIPLYRTQNYARGFARVAWYNAFTGNWFSHRPGSGKSFQSCAYITHWDQMPEGAVPSKEDLDVLPRPWWEPIHFNLLDKIGNLLIMGENSKAVHLLTEKLLPLLTEKCECGHGKDFHASRGSQCSWGSASDPDHGTKAPCSCVSFKSASLSAQVASGVTPACKTPGQERWNGR